jgi:hypothetical protein
MFHDEFPLKIIIKIIRLINFHVADPHRDLVCEMPLGKSKFYNLMYSENHASSAKIAENLGDHPCAQGMRHLPHTARCCLFHRLNFLDRFKRETQISGSGVVSENFTLSGE